MSEPLKPWQGARRGSFENESRELVCQVAQDLRDRGYRQVGSAEALEDGSFYLYRAGTVYGCRWVQGSKRKRRT